MLWELLAADIEGVESVCAVGAVFEEVFFGFGLLLHGFVLAEAVATALHSGTLDGEDEVEGGAADWRSLRRVEMWILFIRKS